MFFFFFHLNFCWVLIFLILSYSRQTPLALWLSRLGRYMILIACGFTRSGCWWEKPANETNALSKWGWQKDQIKFKRNKKTSRIQTKYYRDAKKSVEESRLSSTITECMLSQSAATAAAVAAGVSCKLPLAY